MASIVFLLAFISPGYANIPSFYFSTLDLKDGLSQLSVLKIYQDSYGFMWFATRNGLNKYDGTAMTVYKRHNNNPNSLSNNHITSIVEDKAENLWIGTMNGLNCLNLQTGRITRYDKHAFSSFNEYTKIWITDLYIDRQEHLWVATNNGLYCYQPDADSFRLFDADSNLYQKHIVCIVQDSRNNLLIGTMNDGLYIYDESRKFVHQYKRDNSKEALTENYITAIYEDKQGFYWIGTRQSGLNKIDRSAGTVTAFTTGNSNIGNDKIRSIIEYEDNLVLCTWDGLALLNPQTGLFFRYTNYEKDKGGLNHFSVYSTYVDKANTFWAGTYSGGVSYSNRINNRFQFLNPKTESNSSFGIYGAMDYQKEHTLWIASEGGGLLSLDLRTKKFSNYPIEPLAKTSSDDNIIKSVMVEDDIVWCGTQKGTLYKFNTRTKTFSLFYSFKKNISIYTITRSLDKTLWVGTTDNDGLIRFSTTNNKREEPALLADSMPMMIPSIRNFIELRENVFLIGTHLDGLFLLDMNKGAVIRYNPQSENNFKLYNEYVTSIVKDPFERIWIGTYGGGFCLFDEKEGIKERYTTEKGLSDDNICAAVWGGDDKLWLSTSNGISSFDPSTKQFVNYVDRNEIGVNEFSIKGGIRLPNNEVFFSGSHGLLFFHPEQLIRNTFVPSVVFTSLTVNNKTITPGDKSHILGKNIYSTSEIILKPDQNNFSIGYAALNYLYPYQNIYAYKLDGYDKDWNYAGNRQEAFYTNLKPGYYTFRVKASNNDGKWNETGASISLRILTPVWQTWYAYLIYVLVFLAILYTIYHYLQMKRNLERDLIEKQKEQQREEELYQARIRMFTNFSHELRTPLTLIIPPLEEILQRIDLNNNIKGILQMIYNNTQRLLLLVNQLMDLRKNESGNMQLHVSKGDLYHFVREIYIAFNQIAEKNQITFNLYSDTAKIDGYFDRSLLEKVVFNLLSNAFKHTQSGESVSIHLQEYTLKQTKDLYSNELLTGLNLEADKYVCLEVKDTGKGIDDSEKSFIFTPFYQGKNETSENIIGTGIGLSLVHSIIKLHQGLIHVEDNQPKGTIFRILIPIDKSIYSEEQIIPSSSPPVIQENNRTESPDTISLKHQYLILLVEDNNEVRMYVKQRLEPYFDVLEADNGVKALEIIEETLPDMVISDIMMPQMDGLRLCTLIKQDIRTGHIPVIIVTAKSMVMHLKEGFQCGADDYVVKPFNMEILLYRIRNIFAAREHLKELYGKKFSLKSLGIETTSIDDRFMQKFFEIIEKHITNPTLNVDLLCKEIGMGRAGFYRKLKAITNLSPVDLIRNKRLEIATKMLTDTDLTVSEISFRVGFNSNTYFTTCFRSLYGVSPTEYIQQKKK
jgi:signal transduction histidine kinase/ligand-binding sensor domain-containing protein/DNA-binding NarL/FixJ family response regulator